MKPFSLLILACILANTLFGQRYVYDTAIVNNRVKFVIKTKDINADLALLLVYRNSKVILADTLDNGGLMNIKLIDFNKDNSRDIMLTYIGNNLTYFLYLFDPVKNAFKKVEDFDKFPDAIQLKTNPKYYYSYHRAGCADFNWVSDLFTIENFKAIHKGHIYGQGCDADIKEYPQQIEIFKILNNNEMDTKRVAKLDYNKHIAVFGEKWDFIEAYWNKNYFKFK